MENAIVGRQMPFSMAGVLKMATPSSFGCVLRLVAGISVEDEFRVGTRRGRYAIPGISRWESLGAIDIGRQGSGATAGGQGLSG